MKQINMADLDFDHEPKYKIEYQKPGEPFKYIRYAWNPVLCKDFIRNLNPSFTVKLYRL